MFSHRNFATHNFSGDVTISGTVSSRVDKRFDGDRMTLSNLVVDNTKIDNEKILIYLPNRYELSRGDSVTVSGDISAIEPFESELGRIVQYDRMMQIHDIGSSVQNTKIIEVEKNFVLFEVFDQIFFWARRALQTFIPFPSSSLSAGVLIGDQSGFPEDLIESVRGVGLSHIIVLSGFNVTLVASLAMTLGKSRGRRASALAGFSALLIFLIFVGPTQSLLRASIMTSSLILVRNYGTSRDEMRALVLAVIVIGIISPAALVWDVGFHLSACATAGLILFANRLEQFLIWLPTRFEFRQTVTATIAAQLGTLAIQIYYFGWPSPLSLPANILVVPLVPYLMLVAFGVVMTSWLPMVPWIFGIISWGICEYMFAITRIFS